MEKKRDTVIPADLKRLFVKWDIYVPLVTKGLRHFRDVPADTKCCAVHITGSYRKLYIVIAMLTVSCTLLVKC